MKPVNDVIKMRPVFTTMALMILFAAFITLACSDQKETEATGTTVTAGDVKEEAKEAIETAGAYTQQQKEAYLKQMEARINELDRKIDELQAKAESKASALGKDARNTLDQSLADLRQQKQETAEKYEELKSASDQAWEDVKSGLDAAVDELSAALDQAASHFE